MNKIWIFRYRSLLGHLHYSAGNHSLKTAVWFAFLCKPHLSVNSYKWCHIYVQTRPLEYWSKHLCLSGHFSDETSAVLLHCFVSWFKCTCMVPWLGLLLAFPVPQRTWPSLVLPGTFPLMKCTFCWSAWPSSAPWPPLNGNFPFFHASLPASLTDIATLVCVTHVPNSQPSARGRLIHKPSYTCLPLLDWLADCLGNWLPDLLKGWLIAEVGGSKWDKGLDAETLTDVEQ